ncbi:MAG: lambda exonuclease family protein [Hyphomicrobiaceae bacterium]
MTIRYHPDVIQGSEEWLAARCGMLTASEFERILTPTLKIAENDKKRAHVWEMAAQRITQHVEPGYISDAMLRGHEDEIEARELYAEHFAPVEMCGFVTNDRWGFTLGCSPDGLVGADGLIEVKSHMQRLQVQAICGPCASGGIPADVVLQVQGQLLITERKWCDVISYSGGLPMVIMRAHADAEVQSAIVAAAERVEAQIAEVIETFHAVLPNVRHVPTVRRIEMEMHA